MNLKKTLLSFMAAGAILAGGIGGVAAQSASDTTEGTVAVTTIGSFNAQFCDSASFDGVALSSSNAGTAVSEGQIQICYTDTLAHRGVFRTHMQAGNFNGNGFNIPAEGLKPAMMYNPASGQWGPTIGGIGAMKGNATYSGGPGGYVSGSLTGPEGPWVGGSLESSQYVGYGNAGVGTGGSQYLGLTGGNVKPLLENGSVATIGLKLEIPANTPAGNYVSTFTLSVTPVAP